MNANAEAGPGPDAGDGQAAIDLAREYLYRYLSAVLNDPRSPVFRIVLEPQNQSAAISAADLLREEAENTPVPLGFGELPAPKLDLVRLIGELRLPLDRLIADYDGAFGLVFTRDCPPYETDYCANQESFFRAQQLADIAGFYRAFGLNIARDRPERPDHIALELEFMGLLITKKRLAAESDPILARENAVVCHSAERSFLIDHLAWWAPTFAAGLRRKAGNGLYAAVARVLAAFLPAERARFDVKAPQVPLRPTTIERPEEAEGCVSCTAGA